MAGIVEGVNAGELPAGANTLPATAPLFHGLADSATAASAKLWAERSPAAGTTGVALKFVRGLWLINPGTSLADAWKAASPTGLNAGTTGVAAQAPHLWDSVSSVYRPAQTVISVADGGSGGGTQAAGVIEFNGTNWDRRRNNTEGIVLAAAARTVLTASAPLTNHNARGVVLCVDVSVNPGGGRTLSVEIDSIDPATGNGTALVVTTPSTVGGASNKRYRVVMYPGAVAADLYVGDPYFGVAVSLPLPRTWRVVVGPSDAASWTYSVSFAHVL